MNPDLSRPLALLEQGRWQEAHEVVQDDETELGCWLHGIVHLQEGDFPNARYWYSRARRDWPDSIDVTAEVEAVVEAVRRVIGGSRVPG